MSLDIILLFIDLRLFGFYTLVDHKHRLWNRFCEAVSTVPNNSYALLFMCDFLALEIFILVESEGQGVDRLAITFSSIYRHMFMSGVQLR